MRLHFTPECKIGDPERSRAQPCWTILAPKLSCCTTHLQQRGCSCSVLSRVCTCECVCLFFCACVPKTEPAWQQLSLPLRGSPGRSWPPSPESTSKRAGTGLRGHKVPGRPARLLLLWALGARELRLECRYEGVEGAAGGHKQGEVQENQGSKSRR